MIEPDYSILPKLVRRTKPRSTLINLTGQRFTRWLVLGYVGVLNKHPLWLCKCDCGSFKFVEGAALRAKSSKSCGCYKGNKGAKRRTHGMTKTPAHNRWLDMVNRCDNPNGKQYNDYGGRGITVCRGFRKFENFYELMGHPPPKTENNRIDNDGHYSCGRCEECLSKNWPLNTEWATRDKQARNKRTTRWFTIDGETKMMVDWIRLSGVPHSTAWQRLDRGWAPEEAFGFKERARRR